MKILKGEMKMKKTISLLMAIMLVASLFAMVNVSAADAVVYVDGVNGKDVADGATGTKDNPFNNMVDAIAALSENGGTVTIIGDVKGNAKYTDKKKAKDENGNEYYTDEVDTYQLSLPKHNGTLIITSDGGILDLDLPHQMCWNNYGKTIYRDIIVKFGSQRIMFNSYAGHLIVEESCEFQNSSSAYFYGTGTMEFYNNCGFSHGFANYTNHIPAEENSDTVVILAKSAAMGTLWNGLNALTTNSAYIIKDNATFTTFWGGGQAPSINASVYLYSKNGAIGTANANGSNGKVPAKSFLIGATGGENFKATAVDWTVAEANENADLFKTVEKEYKVTGDVNSFVNVANVSEGAKLYAIVDGAAVEISYCNTLSDGVFFSTVEGATNYVFADSAKEVEKPTEGDSASDTSDPIALIAIFAVVSLAGALVFKKVR